MKSKAIIFSIVWILSLAVTYIIAAKVNSKNQKTADSQEQVRDARPSYRSKISSSAAGSRASSGSRTSSSSGSSSQLSFTDIMGKTDPLDRANSLLALIKTLGPNDFEQVVAEVGKSGFKDRLSEYGMLLHAWAKADPLAALEYAGKYPESRYVNQTILASWAADNPDDALQWAESKYDGDGGNPLLIGIIQGLVNSDPQKASDVMNSMPHSNERSDALDIILPYIIRQGQEQFTTWLESIDDERFRVSATSRIADRLARQDPESAATWVTTLDAGDARNSAIGKVVAKWVNKDVASAVAWTETLSGKDKTQAAYTLIGGFAHENAEQASQWLDTLTDSDGYDRVADGFIWNAASSNPQLALAKVPTIQNAKAQDSCYVRILSGWYQKDAAASEAWMQSNNISEELRERARARDMIKPSSYSSFIPLLKNHPLP